MNRRSWAVAGVGVLGLVLVGRAFADGPEGPEDREVAFQYADERITESSGLAVSLRHEDVVYTHNDSDAEPVVYAVGPDGDTEAALQLDGAEARDWEAIATCPGLDGEPVLWVGDIGDNIDGWRTYRLLRVPEPAEPADGPVPWTGFEMRYADGKARDAEALLCHPRTGRLFVVTKESKRVAGIYRGPNRMRAGKVNEFRRIADAPGEVTDAAFLADGRHAALRGYFAAWIVDDSWAQVADFSPPIQRQGEALAATADGKALLFGSEGAGSSVWRVGLPEDYADLPRDPAIGAEKGPLGDRPAAVPGGDAAPEEADASGGDGAVAAADRSDGIPGLDGQMIALLSAVTVGALTVFLVARRD